MIYEYRCIDHPEQRATRSIKMADQKDWTYGHCSICHAPLELELGPGDGHRSKFKQEFGKWTGVYDYDYGKKATWDLTPPGKLEEMKRRGICKDPFESSVRNF